VVAVVGETDALTAPQLSHCRTVQLATVRLVVVDLAGVQFLASAGLRALIEVNELATPQDRLRVGVPLPDRQPDALPICGL